MNTERLAMALRTCLDARLPAFIWGPPGVGKSATVRQVAAARNLELRDVRAVQLDPVDLRGLPHLSPEGRAAWAIPEFLPRAGEGVLFLDELNAAPASTQAACYQLVLDRRLGEYRLPDGWHVLAAGNRETDRAVVSRMPSALANRFAHLALDVDADAWGRWALGAGIETPVLAFLRFRPELLHQFDPARNERAFPSPRSWEFASRIYAVAPDPAIEFELYAGAVGEGAAAEFTGFLRIFRGLPSPDAILLAPDSAPVPEDPATLYALAGALARRATEQTIDRVCQYANRMPAEFSVLLVRDVVHRTPSLTSTRAFIGWASAHADVLI